VIVRLHPQPADSVTVVGRGEQARALANGAAAVRRYPFELEALDVSWRNGSGAVLARAAGRACATIAASVTEVLRGEGLECDLVEDDEGLWAEQRAGQRAADGTAMARVSFPPAELERLLAAAPRAVARAGAGLGWVAIEPTPDSVQQLRARLDPWPCVLLDAPESVRAEVDPWGVGDSPEAALMERVKLRFDPGRVCNPGRYVRGL